RGSRAPGAIQLCTARAPARAADRARRPSRLLRHRDPARERAAARRAPHCADAVRERRHRQHRLGAQTRGRHAPSAAARGPVQLRRAQAPARAGSDGVRARGLRGGGALCLRAAFRAVRARHTRDGAGAARPRARQCGTAGGAARVLRARTLRAGREPGDAHPAWTAALARQAEACQFQSNAVAMRVRARAARRLVRFSRLPFASVFLVNSGAEANENALKVALRATGRPHVAAIEGGFHGRTAAAGAVTWGAQANWYGFPRTPFEVSFIPRGDMAAISAEVTRQTAAVIVEPVQGLAGAVALGAPFLAALRARCDEVGALLIFDEVQCGVGRTGEPFAANLYGVRPDMLTTAKALGNGFPCAVLMLSPLVAASVKPGSLGTTFGGGPMACAAIEAVIAAIRNERLLERVRR